MSPRVSSTFEKLMGWQISLGIYPRRSNWFLREYKPSAVTVESVFHGKNAKSALVLGQARGAVLAILGRASLDYFELSPAEIKLNVAGHGRAARSKSRRWLNVS